MTRFPANRLCPLSGEPHARILGYIPAASVAAGNRTYRPAFAEILGIQPEDEFPIVQSASGFVFSGWLPPDDFLRRVYEEVVDHSRSITETVEYRQSILELAGGFLHAVMEAGPSFSRPVRLLDYGCGYGALLRMVASREVVCTGFEPSAKRRSLAAADTFDVVNDLGEVALAGPFNVFVCGEVLEHVPKPREVLRFIREHASPDALLLVTVPQIEESYVRSSLEEVKRSGRLSAMFNPWEHLNYFSASTLRGLLDSEGFSVIRDFGVARPVYDACSYVGRDESPLGAGRNAARLFRRALRSGQTTELFCRLR